MTKRMFPARFALVAAFVALALTLVPVALAAKGGNSGHSGTSGGGGGGHHSSTSGGTIEIVLLDSTDGLAHFGQHVTFKVSTSATTYPWVTAYCYQGGSLVYHESNGIFPTSLNEVFTLGPTGAWQGGDADCTAYLQDWDSYSKNGKITNLASLNFHVYS